MRPMAGTTWNIVVTEPISPCALASLQSVGSVRQLSDCSEEALLNAVPGCEALVVRTASRVTRRVIEAGTTLRVIGRGGVGLDNIDIEAAKSRGIPVVFTPHAATEAVADLTFALILGLTWNLIARDRGVREGSFAAARTSGFARELGGLTLGIIGMGRIGQAVARRAVHGFLMDVLYHDVADIALPPALTARRVVKDQLLRESDLVTLHVPLTVETRGMIGARELRLMKETSLLINTSRGAVVDGMALSDALRSGRLGGAGLDVFEPEPPSPDHPLLNAPNTLFTPHAGSRTVRTQERMNDVVDDVLAVLAGKLPRFPAF